MEFAPLVENLTGALLFGIAAIDTTQDGLDAVQVSEAEDAQETDQAHGGQSKRKLFNEDCPICMER